MLFAKDHQLGSGLKELRYLGSILWFAEQISIDNVQVSAKLLDGETDFNYSLLQVLQCHGTFGVVVLVLQKGSVLTLDGHFDSSNLGEKSLGVVLCLDD